MQRTFEKVPNLQVGGPTPAPPTPPVIRVVLLHTEPAVQELCPDTVVVHHSRIYCSSIEFFCVILAFLFLNTIGQRLKVIGSTWFASAMYFFMSL